jgi:metallophosphoesterase (TIGR00282 family)
MKILYMGDIMAEPGMLLAERVLPGLRRDRQVDMVIAQAENVTNGKGMSPTDYQRLRRAGVDGFTGGNHTLNDSSLFPLLSDPTVPITGPANMADCPGPGYKYVKTAAGRVLIISLLGQVVGKDADKPTNNPLQVIDEILESQKAVERAATIVNLHGDFSSEKVVIGHYLDGRVTVVVGDHWHTPTADARVLPGGTAHQTDVGMCGTLNSSLGVTYDSIIPRWRDGQQTRNALATEPPYQFNALLVTTDGNGLAREAESIQLIFES